MVGSFARFLFTSCEESQTNERVTNHEVIYMYCLGICLNYFNSRNYTFCHIRIFVFVHLTLRQNRVF